MLSSIRAFAHTWYATALIGMLIISFLGWGVGSYLHGKTSDDVITAGSHELAAPDFKRIFDGALERASQQQGQPIPLETAVAAGEDAHLLDQLATEEAYYEFAKRLGLDSSDSLVGQAITREQAFNNPVSGKFDRQVYLDVLQKNKLTAKTFEGGLRDEIMQEQLDSGLAGGLQLPRTYAALFAVGKLETRDLSLFVLDGHAVPDSAPPTDAEMQAFITQNADRLKAQNPETRQLTVVRFSTKALTPTMPVDPAQLQKYYAFRKDAASTPEKRSLVQIPVKDAAAAAAVAAKLRAGQDPAAVARSIGAQPITFTSSPQAAVPDAKIAAAAFAMKPGEVSGLVQGEFGPAVIKLLAIQPGHVATLDELRPQLEAQIRADAAKTQVAAMVRRFDDARGAGAGVLAAAQAAGATPQTIGPVTAQGATADGQQAPGVSEALLTAAFKLPAAGDGDLGKDAPGEYFAFHLDRIIPSSVPTLAALKPRLAPYLMGVAKQKALAAKADQLVARIHKGESLESVAASVGATVQHPTGVTRAALGQNRVISPQLAEEIFTAKKGEVFTGPTGQLAVMIARIDASGPPNTPAAAQATVQGVADLSPGLAQDVVMALHDLAKTRIKPKADLTAARQAIGVTPEMVAKAQSPLGSPAP